MKDVINSVILYKVPRPPRIWPVMLAACTVVRRCHREFLNQFEVKTLSSTTRHVRDACFGRPRLSAVKESRTPTARLRQDSLSSPQDTNLQTTRIESSIEGNILPSSQIEKSFETSSIAQEQARNSKPSNGPDHSDATFSFLPRGFQQPHDEVGLWQMPQITSAKHITVKDWKVSSAESQKAGIEASEVARNIEQHPFRGAHDANHVAVDDGGTKPAEALSQESPPEQNLFDANDEMNSPSRKALHGDLRSPEGTRTESGPRVFEKASVKNPSPEARPARGKEEPAFYRAIRAASVQDIEQKLHNVAHHNPNMNGILFMLKELIEIRHVQPQVRHYEALILANCEARRGCADDLHAILDEMQSEKIGIRTSTLSAVLKVLSVHPDAQLLDSILQTLSGQWTNLSTADTIHVILASTRLNHFEHALSTLEHLISISPPPNNYLESPIPQYLYTTILYRLASPFIADYTAVLHLHYLLTDNNLPISNVCTSYLLDSAAEALHVDLTLYLWRSHIDTNYIIPSTGLCQNVLLMAAREGNAELAKKARRILAGRRNRDARTGLRLRKGR
jgi:hypothetical protein